MMTIDEFLALLKPLIDTLLGLLSYEIFGVPVYAVAFTMFLTLVFAGFVVNINGSGLVGLGTFFFRGRSSRREVKDEMPEELYSDPVVRWERDGYEFL